MMPRQSSASAQAHDPELRSVPRKRSILGGRIVFNNRCSTLDCVVRDLSETGAKLALDSSATLPSEFELEIPHKAESPSARVMWHKGGACGVSFIALRTATAEQAALS
jgi:hypothetical protein